MNRTKIFLISKQMKKIKLKDPINTKEKISEIFLVRHGETEANKKKLLFGHLDWNLNKTGISQIKNCSKKLNQITKGKDIHLIITSTLLRAKNSAKIINKKLKIKKTITMKDISEKSEGILEGKTYKEFKETDYKNYRKWLKDPLNFRPKKGESIADLNKRVLRAYKFLRKKYSGKNIIIVAHSGPIKLMLLNILGTDIKKFWNIRVDCGSISIITISKNQSVINALNIKDVY